MQRHLDLAPTIQAAAKLRFAAEKQIYVDNPNLFVGTSLGDWVSLALAAGIATVPANLVTALPREVFLRFDQPTESDQKLWLQFGQHLKAVPSNQMLRWDHCSPLGLKHTMAKGMPFDDEARIMSPDDPRAFELLYDYPADYVPVWSRPWVVAKKEANFPIEFRVFVKNSVVLGVANYYPQVTLPNTDEINEYASRASYMADKLVQYLFDTKKQPWVPKMGTNEDPLPGQPFSPDRTSATLDFLVTESGQVLFLEAGPPFGAGAHPCSFLDQPITGYARGLAAGVELR